MFDRQGLFIEDVESVHDLTVKFRQTLRLSEDAKIQFSELWVREADGSVEIGGFITYKKDIKKKSSFSFFLRPTAEGKIPSNLQILVFR